LVKIIRENLLIFIIEEIFRHFKSRRNLFPTISKPQKKLHDMKNVPVFYLKKSIRENWDYFFLMIVRRRYYVKIERGKYSL